VPIIAWVIVTEACPLLNYFGCTAFAFRLEPAPFLEKPRFCFFGLDRIVISGETNVVAQRAFQAQMRLF
jgi:hypothetical protein